MVRVAWFAAVITATLIGLAVLWRFGAILVLFLFSLAIAAALRPVIHAASSRKFSRRVGLGMVYALLVAAILGGAALILPPLVKDIQQATNDMLTGYENARIDWPLHGSLFQKSLAGQLPPSEDIYAALTGAEGIQAVEQIFGAAGGFFSLLGYLLLSIILSLYWSADRFRFERLSLSLLPAERHEKALHAWRAVETGVGAFLRSTVVESALIFLGAGFGYWALGFKYPVLLAVWVVIAGLIPWFGFPLMLLPALPIWLGISPAAGFGYIILTASVLILVRLLVRPRLFQPPQYNSMLILLFILGMAEGFGLLGVLLAPLLALTLRILFEDLTPIPSGKFSPDLVRKTSLIQKRVSALRSSREAADARLLVDRVHRLARNTRKYLGGY